MEKNTNILTCRVWEINMVSKFNLAKTFVFYNSLIYKSIFWFILVIKLLLRFLPLLFEFYFNFIIVYIAMYHFTLFTFLFYKNQSLYLTKINLYNFTGLDLYFVFVFVRITSFFTGINLKK